MRGIRQKTRASAIVSSLPLHGRLVTLTLYKSQSCRLLLRKARPQDIDPNRRRSPGRVAAAKLPVPCPRVLEPEARCRRQLPLGIQRCGGSRCKHASPRWRAPWRVGRLQASRCAQRARVLGLRALLLPRRQVVWGRHAVSVQRQSAANDQHERQSETKRQVHRSMEAGSVPPVQACRQRLHKWLLQKHCRSHYHGPRQRQAASQDVRRTTTPRCQLDQSFG